MLKYVPIVVNVFLLVVEDDEPVSSKHVDEEVQNGILKLKYE
jgi:hypothetical protein